MKDNINRKPEDIAYLAGYIDADGYIGLQYSERRKQYFPVVTITASRKDILEELQIIAGVGGNIHTGKSDKNAVRNTSRLKYSHKQAFKICEMVLVYLRLKKVQAQLIVHIGEKRRKHPNGRGYNKDAYFIPRCEEMKRLNEGNKSPKIR